MAGQSAKYIPEKNIIGHYLTSDHFIHSDKVSKFACKAIELTDGAPVRRFERIFDRLCIDECQDLVGYDLELVEILLKSSVETLLVGDYRQATFTTHAPKKNKQYARHKIVKKFTEWQYKGLCNVDYHNYSMRCIQTICDFADKLHPNAPNTDSRNQVTTGHDGVFAVRRRHIREYASRYNPQPLRYNRKIDCDLGSPINFGASKGMTFERILIYPHKKLKKYLSTGKLKDVGREREKIYVAVTRARQSVAFVIDDLGEVNDDIDIFDP